METIPDPTDKPWRSDTDLDIDGKPVGAVELIYTPYCARCQRYFMQGAHFDEAGAREWIYGHVLLHRALDN